MRIDNLMDFLAYFKDDEACIKHFENLRFKDGVFCPHCGEKKLVYKLTKKQNNKDLYHCNACKKRSHVFVNTFFENTKLPIQKWFLCIFLIGSSSKGISSVQLSRQAGITQKTAWTVLHKIRNSFGSVGNLFSGMVEIDETYVGGKEKNKHSNKKQENSQGGANKEVVFGALERGENKRVIAKHIVNNQPRNIQTEVIRHVEKGSDLLTDESVAYIALENRYNRYPCNHSMKEYVIDGVIHNNGIENFWSIFKRGYVGIYHWMSKKHLQKYLNEYAFRYNHMKGSFDSKLDTLLRNSKKLTYKDLINGR